MHFQGANLRHLASALPLIVALLISATGYTSEPDICDVLLTEFSQAQTLKDFLASQPQLSLILDTVLVGAPDQVAKVVHEALNRPNLRLGYFTKTMRQSVWGQNQYGGVSLPSPKMLKKVDLFLSSGRIIADPPMNFNTSELYDREHVFIAPEFEPWYQVAYLVHELAHATFNNGLVENIDELSKKLPTHFLRRSENGRYLVNLDFWQFVSELYAYEIEYLVWEQMYVYTQEWPKLRPFWRPGMPWSELRATIVRLLVNSPMYGFQSPILSTLYYIPVERILEGALTPTPLRKISLPNKQVDPDRWIHTQIKTPNPLSESDLIVIKRSISRHPEIFANLKGKFAFYSHGRTYYSRFIGKYIPFLTATRINTDTNPLNSFFYSVAMQIAVRHFGVAEIHLAEVAFDRYRATNFPTDRNGKIIPLSESRNKLDFRSAPEMMLMSIALFLKSPEELKAMDQSLYQLVTALLAEDSYTSRI